MKGLYRKAIVAITKKLARMVDNWQEKPNEDIATGAYHSLSPINNADASQYIEALTWALDNRKEKSIYNVAITGPYGSGKSSILRTFQQKNENKDYVFLEISLATFKEQLSEKDINEDKVDNKNDNEGKDGDADQSNTKKNDDVLRLIELSILQQIFYHEEDKKIPDSRFKKIRSFKRKNMVWITVGIMTVLLFGLNLFLPDQVAKILKTTFPTLLELILHWLSLIIFLASLSIVIFRSIRLVYGLKISKFRFKEAEIEIDKGISKSILNNHLDEILYFFDVTGYSVVIIEDLDRFRRAEIFTKLRELNLLINNSKKIKQEVVFIYAVRDEMFQDKDRTKFFDFIIPVIPVINSSNSNEKFATVVEENKYDISGDLIDDISLFIDDMRLLYNITNEYHIYHKLLGAELDQDKLMAMIVYKNIYPDDFVLLSDGKGRLFNLLNNRVQYINDTTTTINSTIQSLKAELKQIEDNQIKDADQLRMIYLLNYVNKIPGFKNFIINGNARNQLDVANDADYFAYITEDDVEYNYYYTHYNSHYNAQTKSDIKFSSIESDVDGNQSYEEKLQLITDYWEDREEAIKSEIQKLEKQKTNIRHLTLQQILADKSSKLDIDSTTKQGLLLRLLLRSGYINEDYLDYISLFYEGSITKEDRTFLLNVKSQSTLAHEYALNKVANLIGKIRTVDFEQPYLLNNNLLDFLLVNAGYRTQLDNLLKQLHDNNDYGTAFIEGFLTTGTNIDIFIRALAAKWPALWKYVSTGSTLTKERKQEYFKLIIANVELEDLKKVAEQSNLIDQISENEAFLSIIPDEDRIEQVIKLLNIKFKNLEIKDAPQPLVDFVYRGNYYKMSLAMLEKMIQHKGIFNKVTFDTSNYQAVTKSGLPELMAYIEANINEYMTDVYLAIPTNTKEEETELITLLNNKEIKLTHLVKVIEKSETKVSDITKLTSQRTDDILFEEIKVVASWQNLIEYYARLKQIISPEMVTFLNDDDNAKALANDEINISTPSPDLTTVEAFMLAIVNEKDIDGISYEILLPNMRYDYDLDDIHDIGEEKIKLLIDYFNLRPTADNFIKLKAKYPALRFQFLIKSKNDFLTEIANYELEASDINFLMRSGSFTPAEKKDIIDIVGTELIASDGNILKAITKLIFDHHRFTVDKEILIASLKQPQPINDRVKLFNMHYQSFNKAEIPAIFSTFPYPYSDIGVLYTSPVIDYGDENRYLVNNLKSKGFIANSKDEKKGIRIINFKKSK